MISVWRLIKRSIIVLGSSLLAVFSVIEIYTYFIENNFFENLLPYQKIYLYLSISLIITSSYMVYYTYEIAKSLTDNLNRNEPNIRSDSILAMVNEAHKHSHWEEVIKIGTSLSEVLWYTGRNGLRLKIGEIMKIAAEQINDYEVLANTLVEDLGVTNYSLGEKMKAKTNVMKGIELAKRYNYYFILARGYRNMSCMYIKEKQVEKSTEYYTLAVETLPHITDEFKSLEAKGSIEYANSKILMYLRKYEESIISLDKAKEIYKEISQKFPDKKRHNQDRIVKMHKQKGILYLEMNDDESYDNAYECFSKGLQLAKKLSNYDNIVLNSIYMAEILFFQEKSDVARNMFLIAKKYIEHVATRDIINKYKEVQGRLGEC